MKVSVKAAIVYYVTILYAGSMFLLSSSTRLQGFGGSGNSGGFVFDKLDHILEYSILGGLLYLCFHLTPLNYHMLPVKLTTHHQKISVSTFILGTLYGISDEIHQIFVPGRSANPLDVLADAMGIVIAVLLMPYILRLYRKHWKGRGGKGRETTTEDSEQETTRNGTGEMT